ncbi:diguanylate cyclase domain-containing protein [Alkanindiges sp. WGS2144]|uniref:GGDEF domain-containing protein n=1 Tax=Alkanindiges sp. WGS2144 TaxID=3366808 RepID=UPI0037520CFE
MQVTRRAAALPDEIRQEDQLIRNLLADRSRITRPFPEALEHQFWQSVAERALQMIRNVAILGMLVYILIGLITFLTVYLVAYDGKRLHDLLIWALMYLNGAVCLSIMPVIANLFSLSHVSFQRLSIILSFIGIFFTTFLALHFEQPRLIQQSGYIVVFVYMLIYFLTGVRPLTLLFTCLVAGLLPLPIAWMMKLYIDPVYYFYAIIFSNFIGFFISQTITGKERISFLQGRLLELDKLHSRALSDELTRLSNEDALTGLYNRRYFNEMISQEWERAERSGEALSLVFIDIDCFKNYNDSYGHLKGDEALVKVSQVFKQNMRRTSDLASRYGGEEFTLLLPNTPSAGAQVVANNIMRAIDALKIPHKASSAGEYLSLSIGVTTWNGEPDMDATQLIAQADMAVYQAKAAGRHLVRVFEPE